MSEFGRLPEAGAENSVIIPAGVIRPILFALFSANQRFPSGPRVIPLGTLPPVGMGNSVTTPAGVIRPIWLPVSSVNHRFPSGPALMPAGLPVGVGIGNSVIAPVVVMRPIAAASVNQIAPSGPVVERCRRERSASEPRTA